VHAPVTDVTAPRLGRASGLGARESNAGGGGGSVDDDILYYNYIVIVIFYLRFHRRPDIAMTRSRVLVYNELSHTTAVGVTAVLRVWRTIRSTDRRRTCLSDV